MQRIAIAVASVAALLVVGARCSPAGAQAGRSKTEKPAKTEQLKQTGTIISVDPELKMFICKWQTNHWPYKVTDKTVFRLKGKAVAFDDLKLDSRVSMTFHMDGKQRVADIVTIEQ